MFKVKNFLFFLLGFFIVFATGIANAAYPGVCHFVAYYSYQSADNEAFNHTSFQVDEAQGRVTAVTESGLTYGVYPYKVSVEIFYRDTPSGPFIRAGYASGSSRTSTGQGISLGSPQTYFAQLAALSASANCPAPCEAPNAKNNAGQCVPCPSGVFDVLTDQCIPQCNFANPYVPGEIYNPGDGQGTCIAPPCGSGQVADAEGRCQPNCPVGQKINITTGSCVLDCGFGNHEVEGQCVPDCEEGLYKDAETGQCLPNPECQEGEDLVDNICMPKCDNDETRDENGQCVGPELQCPQGQHKDEQGSCVPDPPVCPSGTTYDQVSKTCKSSPVLQETHTEVQQNADGTTTTSETTTTTTSNGHGGTSTSSSSTTTTTSSSGGSDTETTYTPPNVEKYTSPPHQLDWSGWNYQIRRISEQGPVKLLHDVKAIIDSFDVEPETPVFHPVVAGHEFVIDLSPFDGLAAVVRFLLSVGMTIGIFWFGFKLFGFI